jgi:pimeloyl-ACP methyl ester carboxylesterase
MPVLTVVGGRSPEVTHRIARQLAAHVPRGSVRTLAAADHALTTTHAEAVAEAIAELATKGGPA